jgi:hypothetical protein
MNLARSKSRLQLEQLPDQGTAPEAKNLESKMSITSSDKKTDGSNSTGEGERELGAACDQTLRLIRRVSDSQQASLLVVLVAAAPDHAHSPFRPPKTLTLALAQHPLIFLSKSLECAE